MEKELVSVIIPTFGGSDSLKTAVDCLMEQTYPNVEIIVVDDNNADSDGRKKTERMMAVYANAENVRYLQHECNKNGSAARNTGLAISQGSYIVFFDDDDYTYSNRIEKQVEYLERHPEFDACYCWYKKHGIEKCSTKTGDLRKELLELSFSAPTSSIMLRRNVCIALNGFDESFFRHQDYEFLLRFYARFHMGVVKTILVERKKNEINNSFTGEKLYTLKNMFLEQFNYEIERLDKLYPGYKKRVYAKHYSYVVQECLRYGNYKLAWKVYREKGRMSGYCFWKCIINRGTNAIRKRLRILK